ncbi:MAG: hypothetical protein ACKVOW_01275 [Chitinophagaceae bacterium]
MKNRYLAGILGIFILSGITGIAQDAFPVKQQVPDKPFIFSQLPERIKCTMEELQELFHSSIGSSMLIQLEGGIHLKGVLTEKIIRSVAITSINIKLTDYPGALFSISLIQQPGQSLLFNGRIVHPQSGDVFVLAKENNQYFLQKKLQKFFMTE